MSCHKWSHLCQDTDFPSGQPGRSRVMGALGRSPVPHSGGCVLDGLVWAPCKEDREAPSKALLLRWKHAVMQEPSKAIWILLWVHGVSSSSWQVVWSHPLWTLTFLSAIGGDLQVTSQFWPLCLLTIHSKCLHAEHHVRLAGPKISHRQWVLRLAVLVEWVC